MTGTKDLSVTDNRVENFDVPSRRNSDEPTGNQCRSLHGRPEIEIAPHNTEDFRVMNIRNGLTRSLLEKSLRHGEKWRKVGNREKRKNLVIRWQTERTSSRTSRSTVTCHVNNYKPFAGRRFCLRHKQGDHILAFGAKFRLRRFHTDSIFWK